MACIQDNAIYSLTNVKGGTCMDLSGADNRSIIGYGFHNGPNQAWIFQKTQDGRGYNLKSAGSGQYVAPEGDPTDGRKLIATGTPYAWRVEDEPGEDSGVRLSVPDTPFCVDLSDHGNPTPGTPIGLWGRWEGKNQVWRLNKIQ